MQKADASRQIQLMKTIVLMRDAVRDKEKTGCFHISPEGPRCDLIETEKKREKEKDRYMRMCLLRLQLVVNNRGA